LFLSTAAGKVPHPMNPDRPLQNRGRRAFVEAVRRFVPNRQFVNCLVLFDGLVFQDEGNVPGPVNPDRPLQNLQNLE
jgi:hypothetical protein